MVAVGPGTKHTHIIVVRFYVGTRGNLGVIPKPHFQVRSGSTGYAATRTSSKDVKYSQDVKNDCSEPEQEYQKIINNSFPFPNEQI